MTGEIAALDALTHVLSDEIARHVGNVAVLREKKSLFSDPLKKLVPFDPEKIASAQSFEPEGEASFLLLAHIDQDGKIAFSEMEELSLLANDSVVFDSLVSIRREKKDDLRLLAERYGEMAITRCVFLKAICDAHVRSLRGQFFQRLMAKDERVEKEAMDSIQRAVANCQKEMDTLLPAMRHRQEVVAHVMALKFPAYLATVTYRKAGAEKVNGVWLSSEMAADLRTSLARIQSSRPT